MPGVQDFYDKYDGLTAKQRSIADFILSNPEDVCYLSLEELSRRAGASEVSVLRLCRALGFENYVQLKDALRQHTKEMLRSFSPRGFIAPRCSDRTAQDEMPWLGQICATEVSNLTDMIGGLDSGIVHACVQSLLQADEVLVFAHEGSKIFGDYLCYRLDFLRIKATSVKLGDSSIVQATLARLKRNDVVVLLSFPPYHLPIHDVARYSRYRGNQIITITDSMQSPAAIEGSHVFICPTATRFYYNSQVATASFINILASCIAAEMGPRFDEILAEQQSVGDFMSSEPNKQEA